MNLLKQTLSQQRDKLILFFYPLLLILINSNWIFTPATNYLPDPWFYVSYFRYFDIYAPAFPSFDYSYFVERLTWNIPGFYMYQLLPPLQANYVLHLLVYYVAVFSLYGTLRLLFNHRTALISALLMSGYPWFLRAVGWDYSDGIGIAHMLLLIYVLTRAHYSEKHRLWLMLAGAVFASQLITNLFWIGYAPSWAIYFLVLNLYTRKFRIEQFILVAAYFLFGSLVPIALSGLYYYQVTGDFVFFKNSLTAAISLTDDATNVRNVRFIYGHMHPYWHVLPAGLAIASTWQVLSTRRYQDHLEHIALYALFLTAYGWLIFWHLYSIPLLIIFTYSSFVMPTVFLLLGATIHRVVEGIPEDQFTMVIVGTIALLALPLALVRVFPATETLQGNRFVIAGAVLILLILLMFYRDKRSILWIVGTLTILFYFVGEKSFVYVSDAHKGKDHYLAIIAASDRINANFPQRRYEDVRLWFHADENYDTFFSLGGLYLYPWGSVIGYRNSREEPPAEFDLRRRDAFEQGDQIVLLSSNPNSDELVNEANRALSSRKALVELMDSETIRQGSVQFYLYFTRVTMLP